MKISVSTLVRYLKNRLEIDENLQAVLVSGEISNFKPASSGHWYFSLKDETAQISCVMFASKAKNCTFLPKNGDKVLINGNVSLYEGSGSLQLYVNSIKMNGIGDLFQQYEELKNKLENQGYFADDHKKNIPTLYPEKIAVLVGENSAAMSDIKSQFLRRWPLCIVDYYPVLVQGIQAPQDIIDTLLKIDNLDYDCIILARGGGSFEDLFCFNDEKLIKCIYNLNTFIICGIGHQQDFTLCDFVADLRAPTPTACVELITPDISDLKLQLDSIVKHLDNNINKKIDNKKQVLTILTNNRYLLNPLEIIEHKKIKIDFFESSLEKFSHKTNEINNMLDYNINLMKICLNSKLSNKQNEFKMANSLLEAYSYENTLKRGFSIIYKDNKIIKNKNDIANKDLIKIKVYDGEFAAVVKKE